MMNAGIDGFIFGNIWLQVWSSLILYRKILDAIEDNDYDNLTKRAYVGRTKKFLTLPLAYTRSLSAHRLLLH